MIADCIVTLRKNYRFRDDSAIGRVTQAINKGDVDRTVAMLKENGASGCVWWDPPSYDAFLQRLRSLVLDSMSGYGTMRDPMEALALIGKLKILCAVRNGPFGVRALNGRIEEFLASNGSITPSGAFYSGKPVMVTRNDYSLDLYNGDQGIIMPGFADGAALKAFFPDRNNKVKSVFPHRLPPFETAYAMTVHKAQGSEFERAVLILPPAPSPVVTRELFYTAATRSRTTFELWCTEETLRRAIATVTKRTSGLREALWGTDAPGSVGIDG